ncbi:XdhC family protein [Thioalkalivibrio sp. HK1]|uniref:XdhC family protein n=1 Tax=Thioalkalivibrio sp. HK1 TaxID=1469245 RepID=UPI00046F138A|nr:XdhC family protein [Thioalkalivibrio sp. HK1]
MTSQNAEKTPTPAPAPLDARLDPLQVAERWLQEGRIVALATVIATWGSSPRPVGSRLVIDQDGCFEGSVSGGCIEGAVVAESIETIRDGRPRTLDYGVSNERAWEVGLTCGGRVQIHIERIEG